MDRKTERLHRDSIPSPEVMMLQEQNVRPYFINFFFLYSRLIYPAVITFCIASVTFPHGFGQFMAGEVRLGSVLPVLCSSVERYLFTLCPNNLVAWKREERYGRSLD